MKSDSENYIATIVIQRNMQIGFISSLFKPQIMGKIVERLRLAHETHLLHAVR